MEQLKWKVVPRLLRAVAGFIAALLLASYALASDDLALPRSASVAGRTEVLYGVWDGSGTASNAIYGRMQISEAGITWKGNNHVDPRCTVTHKRIQEGYGVKFHAFGHSYVTVPGDNRYTTFLLNIKGGKCALGTKQFRFVLDRELPGSVMMIAYGLQEYNGITTDATGYHGFFKQPDESIRE